MSHRCIHTALAENINYYDPQNPLNRLKRTIWTEILNDCQYDGYYHRPKLLATIPGFFHPNLLSEWPKLKR